MQVIEMIADERRGLADVLVAMNHEQLGTRSLCGAWSVHDVAAHLLMPLVTGLPTLMLAMVTSAGNFGKANRVLTARIADRSIQDIAQGLRDEAENPFSPPGMGIEAALTDLLVRGQDIRRPLGLPRVIPPGTRRDLAEFPHRQGAEGIRHQRQARRAGPVRHGCAVLVGLRRSGHRARRGAAARAHRAASRAGRPVRRWGGRAASADQPGR
jgi:uncharacterized protein (TIGR03083 family)